MRYEYIAVQKREDIVFYEEYGYYTWTFLLVTEKDWVIRIYKDYFGSCSWCDTFYSIFDYNDFVIDSKVAIEFAEKYTPFLERKISELTFQDLSDWVTMNNDYDFTYEDQKKVLQIISDKYLSNIAE